MEYRVEFKLEINNKVELEWRNKTKSYIGKAE